MADILMTAAMVLASLADIKTMTRRVVKGVKFFPEWGGGMDQGCGAWRYGSPAGLGIVDRGDRWSVTLDDDHLRRMCTSEAYGWGAGAGCPYGQPGDLIRVRETFFAWGRWETRFSPKKGRDEWHFVDMTLECGRAYVYAANGQPDGYTRQKRGGVTPAWWKRPAIFLPAVASRLTLKVTAIRVERLHSINEADARAEGIDYDPGEGGTYHVHGLAGCASDCAIGAFQKLWVTINGADSWAANPWVWVVSFKRLEGTHA